MGDKRGLSPKIVLKQFWHLKNALMQDLTPCRVVTRSVSPQLPKDYQDDLPSPESIAQRLEQWKEGDSE